MSNKLSELEDYFMQLSISNKEVKHNDAGRKSFYRLSEKETSALATNAASPRVSVEDYGGRYAGEPGGLDKRVVLLLHFVCKAATANEASREEAYMKAEAIMDQFIAKIEYDVLNESGCFLLQLIDFRNLAYDRIGPISQQGYGYELSIPLTTGGPKHNTNNWQ